MKYFVKFSGLTILFLMCMQMAISQTSYPRNERLENRAQKRLEKAEEYFLPWQNTGKITLDSVHVSRQQETVYLFFHPNISHIPIRYPWLLSLETEMRNLLGRRFRNYDIVMLSRGKTLDVYIPNYFRQDYIPKDTMRMRNAVPDMPPLVRRTSLTGMPHGLAGSHIALWHSHGLYYNAAKDRWQWQRARLFGTVEDLFPTDYVLRYITPMLENAGANVLLPRERDHQLNEVIVDHDQSTGQSEIILQQGNSSWITRAGGFRFTEILRNGDNPFAEGNFLSIEANSGGSLVYVPDIPEDGYYAVYLSWGKTEQNVPDVSCTVNYHGGNAVFTLNQQMGYETWVYLGTFWFSKGMEPSKGSLTIYTHSSHQGLITADAAKFGGGMGNVARRPQGLDIPNQRSVDDRGTTPGDTRADTRKASDSRWKTSGMPRFTEGSRYYLQYAGMPDTLVYSLNEGKNDYNDDFMSRGEWVNYLMGSPLGPTKDRESAGLGIPVDLVLAFHTDAGITANDSVIGTLSIYSAQRDEGIFPDGLSRLASRDLTDIIQHQIVGDIRALYNPRWTRRAIWDRQYSEAWRPNVPSMLLELLSHQNLADMRYGHDPQFQFDVSRAIYKAMLRYVAHQQGREAIVQPLPPVAFTMEKTGEKTISLSWQPQTDPLEPSAEPEAYVLYTRREGEGFDQGVLVQGTQTEVELPQWNTVFSFRVTAVNKGGESFPSEILSAAMVPGSEKTVLVVNGFQRLSGPGIFDSGEMAGLTWWDDHGIPYNMSLSQTGQQYDYDRNSPWLDDDSPGWGASHAYMEGKPVAGNTFDYPYIHGISLRNAGYSFISSSRQAFESNNSSLEDFFALNLVMGKQKGTPSLMDKDSIRFRVFTPEMMAKVQQYAREGGNILVSGAYIGSDSKLYSDTVAMNFSRDVLGYSWRTNNATTLGKAGVTDAGRQWFDPEVEFVTLPNPHIYHVEAPDAIEAEGEQSSTVYRYTSGWMSAVVAHRAGHRVVAMGFPFETILTQGQRDSWMKNVMEFFEKP